jgi:hypothetical protein
VAPHDSMVGCSRINSWFAEEPTLLIFTALFAIFWAVARAWIQSLTIDEADTYIAWVANTAPVHWEAASNNHVLNSALARIFINVFGTSHLTMRAPSLIGAMIYIAAAYCLTGLISRSLLLRWALFVTMVYNPLVFDYLVAARGYSLAVAFLTAAIAIAAYHRREDSSGALASPVRACALCSICLALSVAANFSFVFVDAALLLMVFAWISTSGRIKRYSQLVAACVAPGLLVTVVISAPAMLAMSKFQLWWGANSLGETFHSIRESSLYELNRDVLNPILYAALDHLKLALFPVLGILCSVVMVLCIINRASLRGDQHSRWLAGLAVVILGAVLISLTAHWVSFRFFRLLLPKDRTALYLAPLGAMLAGILAAFPSPSRIGLLFRRALVVTLFVFGIYFIGCMRLRYFREWKWDADVNRVYDVLSYYNHVYGVKDVTMPWFYSAALNYYRMASGRESLPEFVSSNPPYPPNKEAYVLNLVLDDAYIKEHGLKVVYHGEISDAVVAIRPDVETRFACPPAP